MKPVKLKTVKSKRNATRNVIDHLERRMMLSVAIKAQIPNTTLQAGGTAQTLNMAPYFDDAAIPSTDTVVEFQTNLPSPDNLIPVELTTAATPNTVANFLQYIANGDYSDTVFQRSVPGFVIQGGGFTDTGSAITALGTVNGESSTATLNNTAGTIAMALSSGPNTGSNQWFFNLVNNNGTSAPYDINLDNTSDGGPFTAFGQVIYQGMTVLNDIANLPVVDDTGQGDGQWSSLPVQSGTNGATVTTEATSNLVTLDPIVIPGGLVYAQPNVSNTSVVTATMTQNNLTLTPVGPGTTTVQIEAIDLGLGHVFETFNVTVDAASAKPAVYIGNANGTVGTNSKIVFPITLSNASSSAITFNYSLTSGTAPAGDYQSTASSLTIPAGATSASIPVNLVQDSSGTSENFTITLSGLSSNAVFGSNAATETATGTINPAGTISTEVSIENASGTVGTNSQIVFPVALSAASPSATTFDYSLTADTAASTDYSATGSMVTIPAGSTTASIPVTVIGDSSGAPETFAITLSDVSANALFSSGQATESAIGTINPGAPQASTTTLTASSPVVDLNGAENFTATVTQSGIGPTPTGTVTFELGGASIGTANLSSGVATLSTNLSTAGNDNFTAVYGGDSANLASTSSAVTVNVATLAPAVSRSTVPTSVVSGTPVKGTTTVGLTNDTSTTQKGKVTVKIYASTNGVIDANSVLVAAVTRSVSIAAGKTVNVPVAVTSFPATLPSNTYTLLSQSINTSGQISNATTGPSIAIGAPVISLTESFTKLVLPPSVVAGAKTSATAVLKITNGGNITSTGLTTISLYASTDGTVAGGTLITTITKKLAIKAGKSVSVSVPLGKYPSVANGSYSIVAQVTDPKGNLSQATFATPVTIAAAMVDLSVASVSVPATGTISKGITVTIDLTNAGNSIASGALDIGISGSTLNTGANAFILGTFTAYISVKPDGKQLLHLKVPLPQGTPAGKTFIVATLVSDDVFSDSDFTNPAAISPTAVNIT